MRLVIKFDYLTLKFRVQPGEEWCKVDTELIQDPWFEIPNKQLPFPCRVDCRLLGKESISAEELVNLEKGFSELYAGVENFERPYFLEPDIDIGFIAPYVYKSTWFTNHREKKTEYIHCEPEMLFKINITAPYTGYAMENYITLSFNSEQTLYFYTYIKLVLGIVSKEDLTVMKMLSRGVLVED